MLKDDSQAEQSGLDAGRVRQNVAGARPDADQAAVTPRALGGVNQSARDAEQVRRSAEEMREVQEERRQAEEAQRTVAEEARTVAEHARHDADHARDTVVDEVRATADTLNATLEQMKLVEQMRRAYRDAKDIGKLDSN